MNTVLAALDPSPMASAVLETALRLGELTGSSVAAIHVRDGSTESLEWLAARAGVPLRIVDGPLARALLAAAEDVDVVVVVLGAEATTSGRRRAVGSTTRRILELIDKPVAVVPPDMVLRDTPYRRLLVPLEGSEHTSAPIADTLWPMITSNVELVVLHVFTAETIPPAVDRPRRDLAIWGREFLDRHCPNASRIELRTGSVAARVEEVCREEHADLIVLSWAQDSSPGRAAVVHDVLAHAAVPVLLLPDCAGDPVSLDPVGLVAVSQSTVCS
jgi:nucleotide-binding universal stress UspA family protein